MLSAENLASIESEGRRLAAVAREDPAESVPQYPGWTLADLASHTASIHGRTVLICREQPQETISAPRLPEGTDEIEWYEETLEEMLAALRDADPGTSVWSFGREQNIGFWENRMVAETGVHRWDACQAVDKEDRLTDRVAEAGLNEFADLYVPHLGNVQTLNVAGKDIGKSWVYGDGEPTAHIEGSASDLYLCLMCRTSPIDLPDDWSGAVEGMAPPPKR